MRPVIYRTILNLIKTLTKWRTANKMADSKQDGGRCLLTLIWGLIEELVCQEELLVCVENDFPEAIQLTLWNNNNNTWRHGTDHNKQTTIYRPQSVFQDPIANTAYKRLRMWRHECKQLTCLDITERELGDHAGGTDTLGNQGQLRGVASRLIDSA